MNFKADYEMKKRTAEEAVQMIQPQTGIVVPVMAGEPPALLEALPSHEGLKGNSLYRMLPSYPVLDIEEDRLKQVSLFLSGMDRPGYHEGKVDLLPNHFSDIPDLVREATEERVIMAAVSPMDEDGYFSLGVSPAYTAPLVEDAKQIILEVNERMPRTYGIKNQIHISQVTALIENTKELPEAPNPPLSDKDQQIGKYIADIINDGDTLQIGFGAMPNAVMDFLKDHKDLGVYTEMLPDKIVDLYESGAVTNVNKPLYKGKTTMTFAFGSKRLYDFMHENEDLYFIPCDQTNDVRSISKFTNLVSINTTVEVDFLGQCNSETVKGKYYSSSGGQADFAKGVRLTEQGRGIICLYSTAKNDTISKIVPALATGAVTTTSKNDVDTIVTEYGVAQLKGKTVRERTRALIDIAHPKFREELELQAAEMGLLPKNTLVSN
ncbi:acetyl-CoA hydrolase/transferase family protein [Bacillus sp. FJAT-44742]|uniref:acetyl-CoA hydrolase/transferase family protein n=1 Tax=Bacillus sp. FJAT-44742 TaxID=2014005 RepID=UPI000C244195|nr:acetyl-CoA hydrolase/transferase C-terminal domain-containing protein [Bacillus sp. FJAT-44742]